MVMIGTLRGVIVGGGTTPSTLLNDLVSWWSMDEASGTRVDSHGSNNLTDVNTVGQAVGKVGNAASFVQTNGEYLGPVSGTSLDFGNIDYTIAGWVYPTGTGSGNLTSFIAKGDNAIGVAGVEYYMGHRIGINRFEFGVADSTAIEKAVANTFGAVTLNAWYFLVGYLDSVAGKIYISVNNGAFDSKTLTITPQISTGAGFTVGAVGTTDTQDGRIDELPVWKRKLTAAEIARLFNSGAAMAYPG